MSLDTSALRTPGDSFPPVKDRIVTLIRITTSEVTQASTVTDKREMLRSLEKDDTVVAVWTGQWRSDAFGISEKLLAQWKQELE